MRFIFFFALFLAGIFPAGKLYSQSNHSFDSLATHLENIASSQKEEALLLLEELYEMANNSPDSSLLFARCIFLETILNNRHGIVDSTLEHRIKYRLDYKPASSCEKGLLLYSFGLHLLTIGAYDEAFTIALQASEDFEECGENRLMAKTLNLLGNICNNIYLFDMAETYYQKALTWISPEYLDYFYIKGNMFGIYLYRNKFQVAIDSFNSLMDESRRWNPDNEELYASILRNLGTCYMANDQPGLAFNCWTELQKKGVKNSREEAIIHANLGTYYLFEETDLQQSLLHFSKARNIMEKNGDVFNLSEIYKELSEIFEKFNEPDSALFYLKKHQVISSELRSNIKAVESYQKYVTAFLEMSRNELIIAEQAIELKNRQVWVIVGISASIILLILVFLLFLQQKKQQKELENTELEAKLKIERLEKQQQEDIIDTKTREITSYSLLLSNKNNILQQLLELSKQSEKDPGKAKELNRRITTIIKSNLHTDEEWDNFMVHFKKVHPDFFDKLQKQFPELTQNDLKMAAYIRLGMNIKQIAQMLYLSPDSVKITRYRLRKKLNLQTGDNMSEFLQSL